jgi:DNA-binding CsgD family transcriptional regulator
VAARSKDALALVGRSQEQSTLLACLEELQAGNGCIALITGEAGVGKTRLLDEALRSLKPPIVVATAAAYDYAQAPYAPLRDLLAVLDARLPKVLGRDEVLRASLEPIRALGELAPDLEEKDRLIAQRRALDSVVAALAKYAAAAPILLVVEDLQWIDRASADVLIHVVARLSSARLSLLATYRNADGSETDAARELIAKLMRRTLRRVNLGPLSPTESLALVDASSHSALSPPARRTVCSLGDGNPLLLIELANHAVELPGALDTELPISLQAIVAERIAPFDQSERDLLRVAALLAEFDAIALGELTGQSTNEVHALLRKARDRRILSETPAPHSTYSFRHALIRRAISDELLAVERAAFHRRIAAFLEERGAPASSLAHHYASAGMDEQAHAAYERAGDEAVARLAFLDGSDAYLHAIAGRPPSEATLALFDKYIAATDLTGRTVEALPRVKQLVDWCVANQRYRDAARFCVESSRWKFAALVPGEASDDARRALGFLEHQPDSGLSFEASALLAWHEVHLRRLPEARAALESARPLYDGGSKRARAWYHEARAAEDVHSGRLEIWRDECAAMLREARGIGLGLYGHRLGSAAALALASNVEDFEYARAALSESLATWRASGASGAATTHRLAALVHYTLGDLRSAREAALEAMSEDNDSLEVATYALRVGIAVALRLGDEGLLRRCAVEQIFDRAYQSQSEITFGPLAASFAAKLLHDKRYGEAKLLVEQTIARLHSAANNLEILTTAARLNLPIARTTARALLVELAPRSRSAAATLALVDAYAASGETRRRLGNAAAAGFNGLGWALMEAESLEVAGENAAARTIYERCGASADLLRLASTVERAHRLPGGISRREWDVALLVAEGKSNRAIAQALSLSERTVENHIASIFNKRSLRSRSEIALLVAGERQTAR